MKRQFLRQSLVIALIAISGFGFSQESVLLKYNLAKGKVYVQSTQMTQDITQSMAGQEMKVKSDIISNAEYAIEGVEKDGNATVLISLVNMSVGSAGMGRDTTMKFDDLKDKIRVVFSADGKNVSSAIVDSSEIMQNLGMIEKFLKLQYLPVKSVLVGEKWQDKIVQNVKASGGNPMNMDIENEVEYTLVGKEKKDGKEYYKISYTGTMNITGKGNQMGMEMFIEGTREQGFFYFDAKASMALYTEDITEMDMTIAISGPQNMTIPMTQSIKTVVKFEEKK